MLGAVTSFVLMVTLVKLVREAGLATLEVMVWRMAPGLPIVGFLLIRRGASFRPSRPIAIGARSLFGGLAMGTYFWAVESLTLFQNTVLQLSQPVFVALLAPFVLAERLRGAALLALLLALVGAAVVIAPGQLLWWRAIPLAAGIPLIPAAMRLLSAAFSALAHMTIRLATMAHSHGPTARGHADPPELVVFHFSLWVALACTLGALGRGTEGFLPPSLPVGQSLGLLLGIAGSGVAGQLMLSRAYAATQAPTVAIVGYAAIPLSMVADALVWGSTVDAAGLLGALCMVGAGVLLARSTRRL